MIESEGGRNSLKYLAEVCQMASTDRSVSSLKQKFQNVMLTDDDSIDPVLRSTIEKEIHQIMGSQTLERAKHYARALENSIRNSLPDDRTSLNIKLWKGYDHIMTDSLWNLGGRARSDSHKAWYWGNFVPQIPFQLISRYTSPQDWVLDPFCGSGTTIVEARKLGRNSLGIELNRAVYEKTSEIISELDCEKESRAMIVNCNSLEYDFEAFRKENAPGGFSLAILHPPYWDIIRFSEDSEDLSNAGSMEDFTGRLRSLAASIMPSMADGGHIGLVIGDMYRKGEVLPLGFKSMEALQSLGLKLRGIVVKDIQNTRAKRNSENLWRYRALKSGFYVFKHEYVFVFRLP